MLAINNNYNTVNFKTTDIILNSLNTNKDKQFLGENYINIKRDTVALSKKVLKTQKLTHIRKNNFKINLKLFNLEYIISSILILIILFGFYVIGGFTLLSLTIVSFTLFVFLHKLGLLPKDLIGYKAT